MQNVAAQFQKYPPTQEHLITVLFFLLSDHHTVRIIVQHRLWRQETPRDPVPAEIVSCSWTCDPTKTVWHSVPEAELCPGALLCNTANMDAGITSAGTYIINQLVCTY